jgi:hypothetical protein
MLSAVLLALACAAPVPVMADPPVVSATVVVANDTVVLTVLVDPPDGGEVAIEFVDVGASINAFGSDKVKRAVVTEGGTAVVRLAWALSEWAPNQSRGSAIRARYGRAAAACPGGECVTSFVDVDTWSHLNDARAPAAPTGAEFTHDVEVDVN